MREPIVVELGGMAFTVRPLTIDQVERVETALVGSSGVIGSAMGGRVIAAALARDYPAIVVGDIEADLGEIATALKAILALGGFVAAGEARAAARNADSTGAPSAAA